MRPIRKRLVGIFLPLSILLLTGQSNAMAPVETYYDPVHLEQVDQSGLRRHAPCMMFIDQSVNEKPYDLEPGAMLELFGSALKLGFSPIIVDVRVLSNFLIKRINSDQFINDPSGEGKWVARLRDIPFNQANWQVYHVPYPTEQGVVNAPFFLLVPKQFLDLYPNNNGLRLDQLSAITFKDDSQLLDWITNNNKFFPWDPPRDLARIFKPRKLEQDDKSPIWDFIVAGHGVMGEVIADLSPQNMQRLLEFFNNKITTGLVYLMSCYAGGINLELLHFKKDINNDPFLMQLNYVLTIGSVGDVPSTTGSVMAIKSIDSLFNKAAQLRDKGKSLNELLQVISKITVNLGLRTLHGTVNIPQVWLPGGLGTQTFNVDNRIKVLGEVLTRVYEDENRLLELSDKLAVLLYADFHTFPIRVLPTDYNPALRPEQYVDINHTEDLRATYWKYFPSTIEVNLRMIGQQKGAALMTAIKNYKDYLDRSKNIFPAHKDIVLDKNFLPLKGYSSYLYPSFISMNRRNLMQHFSSIEVMHKINGREYPFAGVLNFIRDAFMEPLRRSTKVFLIDELSGNNDISLLLEAVRMEKNIMEQHALEKVLTDYINKPITLKKVSVQTRGIGTSEPEVNVRFQFNDTAWMLNVWPSSIEKEEHDWNFKEIEMTKYEEIFDDYKKDIATAQKRISKILQKKKEEMRR